MFYGLHYSVHSSLKLRSFSDSDWAGESIDRRFITDFISFLVIHLFFGDVKSKLLFLVQVSRQNIVLWAILLKNFSGFVDFFLTWEFRMMVPLFLTVTIRVLYKLRIMISFMITLNTSRSVVILCINMLSKE